ncbi:MAG: alpha/beta hydrolase [Vampirovibrionales bacterium]|nr:alpha/beta hydrolase [Vampirovibrionales bacterium]
MNDFHAFSKVLLKERCPALQRGVILLLVGFLPGLNVIAQAATGPSERNVSSSPPKTTETLRIEHLNKPRLIVNISYKTMGQSSQSAGNSRQLLDLYLPAATNTAATIKPSPAQKPSRLSTRPIAPLKRTALLFIHGGNFTSGSKEQFSAYCNLFAKAGFVSATMNYSLSPENPSPAAFNDVRAAVSWLQANAGKYGFDPSRIVLVGYSAGGTLALLSGLDKASVNPDNPVASKAPLSEREMDLLPLEDLLPPSSAQPHPQAQNAAHASQGKETAGKIPSSQPSVAGVVSVAGISDFNAFLTHSRLARLKQDIRRYLGEDDARKASPLYQVKAKAPPILLIHGDNDKIVPLSQSRQMLEMLEAARVPALLRSYPGVGHEILSPNPQLGRVLRELTEFFLYIERRSIAPQNKKADAS